MRIVAISDTHTRHDELNLPDGDILIHAGDFTHRGHPKDVLNFLEWFSSQSHRHKIFIAGNHELGFEQTSAFYAENMRNVAKFTNLIYLEHESTELEGIKFFGSPYTPEFNNWGFNVRPEKLHLYWDFIPDDVNVLITHGPPFGILDRCMRNRNLGDHALLDRIDKLAHLKLHIFGHIHVNDGVQRESKFINASILNENYVLANSPVVFEYESN